MRRIVWLLVPVLALAILARAWLRASGPEAAAKEAAPVVVERERTDALDASRDASTAVADDEPGERQAIASSALDTSAWILGTVVDVDHAPVAGAEVAVYVAPLYGPGARRGAAIARTASSDAEGRFALVAPPGAGPFGVRARADGFASASRNQFPGVDAPFELAAAARLTGRLLGEDADQARVYVSKPPTSSAAQERVDDGAARYAVDDLAVGTSVELTVVPAGGLPVFASVPIRTAGECAHDIELGPRRRVEGRVVDALDGHPIEGARVHPYAPDPGPPLALADARGAFALEVQGDSSASWLLVAADGYLARTSSPEQVESTPEIALLPAGRIEGRVVEATGAPVAGAVIEWSGPFHLVQGELASVPRATSASDGTFTLDGLPWGVPESRLSVSAGARRRVLSGVAPWTPRAPNHLEVRLPSGRCVEGRVRWAGVLFGSLAPDLTRPPLAPLATPRVEVVLRREDERVPIASTRTDERGDFLLDALPAGSFVVGVTGEQTSERRIMVRDEPGEPVELALAPPTRAISGHLRSSDGAPLAAQQITARLAYGEAAGIWSEPLSAVTDSAGAFELTVPDIEGTSLVVGVTLGTTWLERRDVGAACEWTVPDLVPVALELDRALEGRVGVRWRGPGDDEGGSAGESAARDGLLRVDLPPGELTLRLHACTPERWTALPDLPVRVVAGETLQRIVVPR